MWSIKRWRCFWKFCMIEVWQGRLRLYSPCLFYIWFYAVRISRRDQSRPMCSMSWKRLMVCSPHGNAVGPPWKRVKAVIIPSTRGALMPRLQHNARPENGAQVAASLNRWAWTMGEEIYSYCCWGGAVHLCNLGSRRFPFRMRRGTAADGVICEKP